MTGRGRILFVTQTAHPWGGVESWLDSLVDALAGDGWKPTVGLVRGPIHHRPEVYSRAHAFPDTVEIEGGSGAPEGRLRGIRDAIRDRSPDIVVPVNIADVLEAVVREKRSGSRIRLFYPLHGLGARYIADARTFAPAIDFAASASRLGAAALTSIAGLPPERVAAIRCGARPPLELRRPESRGPLRLGFVGRLTEPEKRIRQLVSIAAGLESAGVPFELDVAGTGEEEGLLRRSLSTEIGRGVARLHGYLDPDELYRRIYPSIDVLLIFSERETGPLVVWEAMRHGVVPVVSKYRGLSAEGILRDGENAMIVPVGDASGMITRIARLAHDPVLRRALAAAAQEVSDRELSSAEWTKAWVGAFARCLSLPGRRDPVEVPARPPAGRLDRWLGAPTAERLRTLLRLEATQGDPGAEWPHVRSAASGLEESIERRLAALDVYPERPMEAHA